MGIGRGRPWCLGESCIVYMRHGRLAAVHVLYQNLQSFVADFRGQDLEMRKMICEFFDQKQPLNYYLFFLSKKSYLQFRAKNDRRQMKKIST